MDGMEAKTELPTAALADARILLDTVHGSHLYGLAHPRSDVDRYVVVDRRPAGHRKARWVRHTVIGSNDVTVTDLSSFLSMCDAGVPQALEAMFAPRPQVDIIPYFRSGYRAGVWTTAETYRRTITSFIDGDSPKVRRHALRLAHNLTELMATGRFNPVLAPDVAARLTAQARTVETTMAALAVDCPVSIGPRGKESS